MKAEKGGILSHPWEFSKNEIKNCTFFNDFLRHQKRLFP
jgi:hypothetical protein